MRKLIALPAAALRRKCDLNSFNFDTTSDLPMLSEVLGQPRAVAALEFGVSIASHGFNLFALGQPGSGKTTLIRDYLERQAATQPVPPDLCYVHNFVNARNPLPLRLPPGRAALFKNDINSLVEDLRTEIPRVFDTANYTDHRDKVVHELEEKRQTQLAQLDARVSHSGFQLAKEAGGLLLVPSSGGKPLTEEDLEKLTPEQKEMMARVRENLQREIEERFRTIRGLERGARDALRALDTETAAYATRHLINDLRARYHDQTAVLEYLEALQADVIAHADEFRKGREAENPQPPLVLPLATTSERPFARYEVNVLVDHKNLKGAPVIVETNPTYHNLTGRIERQASWGGVWTDHTMIKPGALHRANGGYLIISARECLLNPFAWEGLKRALKDRALRIEEIGAQQGLAHTVTLAPESVPLDIKTVLIGNPQIYYLLYANDEDFQKLFKVKAEFATRMERTPNSERAYALFVSTIIQLDKSLPFDRGAVARIVEYGSRVAEDQDELSTQFGEIADLIREAEHHARKNSHQAVASEDVRTAEKARKYRQNMAEERLQEAMAKGTVLIDTTGSAVGRINGLSVVGLGDYVFGHPVRLTATVGPGRRGVVSIEREVELSGPIHGKGVLILSGFLLRKYAMSGPFSLSASLVFEQSYSMVEGDSASLAELCVLISAVADVPLRQDIAVTGSVNQYGEIQPVGGVTHKIEGFFDLCRSRGFTGTQGVLIPASNQRHLMLQDEVIEAVHLGQFHIWVAEQVDDALELLSEMPCGKPDSSGMYPEGSLHRLVSLRLEQYRKALHTDSTSEDKKSGEEPEI